MDDYPLVSCIMLAGRTAPTDVLSAIKCFQKQTYPNKELIIVNNARNHFDAAALNLQAHLDVFIVDTPLNLSAGMARNYGISAANGQILAQFDADYWHAPTRLDSQVATIAANEAHVAILNETLSYSFASGRAHYQNNQKNLILNTMVFVRPADLDYPNVEKQEELGLVHKMQKNGMTIVSMPAVDLACKLHFTAGPRITQPQNCGLLSPHFKVIKKILKSYRV